MDAEALKRAVRFLGYRTRSETEVQRYLLRQGYSTAIAQLTLKKLRALSYVNDEQFARNYARSRAEGHGYGPIKIAQDLKSKGVAEPLIHAVLRETFGGSNEAKKARSCLERHFRHKKLTEPKIARRAAAFLQRRGYSEEVIIDLIMCPVDDI